MFIGLSLVLGFMWYYLMLPVFNFSFFSTLFGLLVLGLIASLEFARNESAEKALTSRMVIGAIGLVLIMGASILTSAPILHSNSYRNLIGSMKEVDYHKEALPPIEIKNAPLVSYHMANQVAQKKLSEIPALGSQVELGELIKQKIGDKLYWVCFLEHSGFFKWFNTGYTPGYIKVSATDANDVEFVTQLEGKPMQLKYLSSAYMGTWAARRIYQQGNKGFGITDLTSEIDDSGRPFISATLYDKKIGFNGNDAVGVALLDVQTGEVSNYKMADVPAWVDRVHPESFIEDQINDWGEYINGWFNPSNKGKLTISDHVDVVYGQDGQAYFYAGIASVGRENGVVGFALINSRTKASTLYYLAGASESVAQGTAVDVMPEKRYHATNPLPFNVNGVATYIMTLTDDNGIPRAYGMVNIENYQILAVSDSLRSTYQAYLNKLSSHNKTLNIDVDHNTLERLEVVISRISSENKNNVTNYYLMISGQNKMFMATSELTEELILSKVGDKVKVGFEKSDTKILNLVEFDNLEIQ